MGGIFSKPSIASPQNSKINEQIEEQNQMLKEENKKLETQNKARMNNLHRNRDKKSILLFDSELGVRQNRLSDRLGV